MNGETSSRLAGTQLPLSLAQNSVGQGGTDGHPSQHRPGPGLLPSALRGQPRPRNPCFTKVKILWGEQWGKDVAGGQQAKLLQEMEGRRGMGLSPPAHQWFPGRGSRDKAWQKHLWAWQRHAAWSKADVEGGRSSMKTNQN